MEDCIGKISDANALIDAFRQAQKGSSWKESVQRYEMNLLVNTRRLQNKLRDGTYKQKDFYEFSLCERGKKRAIRSMHISDRVVQRTVCDNVIIPAVCEKLIYDNGASLKGKGIDFARRRIDQHLHQYFKHYGNEGYILLGDFSKFFDNVPHEPLIRKLDELIQDDRIMNLIRQMIDSFAVDVSYMTDEEYAGCMGRIYSSIDIRPGERTGEKYMHKSLGIGSQISQICGVYYPTPIDTYCKIVRSHKYYGRYMDDFYVIDPGKEHLKETLTDIEKTSKELGLFLNTRKTQIIKLSHGFTWLKIKYRLTETGGVEKRICRERVTRQRRRLKKYRRLHDAGEMPYEDIEQSYRSWRGNVEPYIARRSLHEMDKLYDELFIKSFKAGEKAQANGQHSRDNRKTVADHTDTEQHYRQAGGMPADAYRGGRYAISVGDQAGGGADWGSGDGVGT